MFTSKVEVNLLGAMGNVLLRCDHRLWSGHLICPELRIDGRPPKVLCKAYLRDLAEERLDRT